MQQMEIEQFIMNYLNCTGCSVLEKAPSHVTVKLSPMVDKELTNRPYYWNFVERTGAEPETMTFTFVFDPDKRKEWKEEQGQKQQEQPAAAKDSILGRYFGVAPSMPSYNRAIPEEHLHYGAPRLQQIFQHVKQQGRYVSLYEMPSRQSPELFHHPMQSASYSSWLNVNFKVEFLCDMKRNEIQSLGICLSTGEIVEDFFDFVSSLELSPKLPARMHLKESISVDRAVQDLKRYLERTIRQYDFRWALEAHERLQDELLRIKAYYDELLPSLEEDKKAEAEAQYEQRKTEIEWQHRPRIEAAVINCGYFHLLSRPISTI
ncbi:YqhG family protein [Marinicrinis lubricantis]|uniref:YqhG family protein n=1 Tax=Marinicrinis lubricantis TaxID=2086470 RepID=A0ABW1INT8_9BACL